MDNKKRIVIRGFSIIALIVTVCLFFYPIIGNIIANQQRSTAVSGYDKTINRLSKKQIEEELKETEHYNAVLFKRQQGDFSEILPNFKNILNASPVIGKIDIPSIDIKNMPIFHGSDPLTLENGLGHYEGSSFPVGGINTRSVITGHSGVKNQILFTDVNTLKKGDVFYLDVLKRKMAYQVFEIKRVLPKEVSAVNIVPQKDLVTLLTCDPPGINTYRLLVTGKRIPLDKAKKVPVIKRNMFSYQNVVIGITLLLLIVLLIGWLVKRKKRK